jgi:hypothetical protein
MKVLITCARYVAPDEFQSRRDIAPEAKYRIESIIFCPL